MSEGRSAELRASLLYELAKKKQQNLALTQQVSWLLLAAGDSSSTTPDPF